MISLRLGTLRRLIREEANDDEFRKRKLAHLRAVTARKAPYLKGQWTKARRSLGDGHRYNGTSSWVAEDPEFGPVYLTFSSSTNHVNVKNSRLRDPSKTRNNYGCVLALAPFQAYSPDVPDTFSALAVGEGRERAAEERMSARMLKMFGVDPFGYLKPQATPTAPPVPEAPVEPQSTSVGTTDQKTYKVYGKRGTAPASTRVKGKVYVAGQDTQFKAGEQARVAPADGKLRVSKTDSDHDQLWEPE